MGRHGGYVGSCYSGRREGGYAGDCGGYGLPPLLFPRRRPNLENELQKLKIRKNLNDVFAMGSKVARAGLAGYVDRISYDSVKLPKIQRIDKLANDLFSGGRYLMAKGESKFRLANSDKTIYGFLTLPRNKTEFRALMKGSNRENYFLQLQYKEGLESRFRRVYLSPPGEEQGFVYRTPKKSFNIVAEFNESEPNLPCSVSVAESYSDLKRLLSL